LPRANALVMPLLSADAPEFEALREAIRGSGRWNLIEPMWMALITDTSASLAEYRAGLSSKVRSETGRLRRKAEREHELTLTALEVPLDLDAQLDRAFAVERSGWKGRAGTAIVCAPETEL